MTIGDIAKTCYEVERAFASGLGGQLLPEWHSAPERTRIFLMIGVGRVLTEQGSGRKVSVEAIHQDWCDMRKQDGWRRGPSNPQEKTHPYLVPFDELPLVEQTKQRLFVAVVTGMAPRLTADATDPEEIHGRSTVAAD